MRVYVVLRRDSDTALCQRSRVDLTVPGRSLRLSQRAYAPCGYLSTKEDLKVSRETTRRGPLLNQESAGREVCTYTTAAYLATDTVLVP